MTTEERLYAITAMLYLERLCETDPPLWYALTHGLSSVMFCGKPMDVPACSYSAQDHGVRIFFLNGLHLDLPWETYRMKVKRDPDGKRVFDITDLTSR